MSVCHKPIDGIFFDYSLSKLINNRVYA